MNSNFPYIRNDMSLELVYKMFNNIKDFKPVYSSKPYKINNMPGFKALKFKGAYCILVCNPSDYERYNKISSYFTEDCRVEARRFDQPLSPLEYWNLNKNKVASQAMEKYDIISNYTLREILYETVPEAGSFRPCNIIAMIKKFNATNILDFSAGWGDRLIAVLAADVKFYCGVDPNKCLHPKYDEIVKTFSKSKTKVTMIESPFETAEIPPAPYDLIFTSPPYFNLEVYSADENQSTNKYSDINKWYDSFLMFSIKKSWNLLIPGGHMIIVINDFYNGTKYTERMIADINLFSDAKYLGVISYAEKKKEYFKSPQPMWIWEKLF